MKPAKKYTSEQARISQTQTTMRIMELLHQYDDCPVWVTDSIAAQLRLSSEETWEAIFRLIGLGHLERRGEAIYLTTEGRRAFTEEMRHTALAAGLAAHEFREEALTGIDTRGEETALEWAALPSQTHYEPGCGNYEEDAALERCEGKARLIQIAAELGETVESTIEGIREGRIQRCKGIRGVPPHWGVFHKHGGVDGQQWQVLCVECRKRARRK